MEPFEVICKYKGPWHEYSPCLWNHVGEGSGPKYNEVCTVTGMYTENDYKFYLIDGHSKKPNDGYDARAFVPLNRQSKTEYVVREVEIEREILQDFHREILAGEKLS